MKRKVPNQVAFIVWKPFSNNISLFYRKLYVKQYTCSNLFKHTHTHTRTHAHTQTHKHTYTHMFICNYFFFFFICLFSLLFFSFFHSNLFILFICFFEVIICYLDLSQNFYCHGTSIFQLDLSSWSSLLRIVLGVTIYYIMCKYIMYNVQ